MRPPPRIRVPAAVRPEVVLPLANEALFNEARNESGGTIGAAAPGELSPAVAGSSNPHVVEVPGIEPGSFVALSGLLRAQLTMPLLGPTNHVSELV